MYCDARLSTTTCHRFSTYSRCRCIIAYNAIYFFATTTSQVDRSIFSIRCYFTGRACLLLLHRRNVFRVTLEKLVIAVQALAIIAGLAIVQLFNNFCKRRQAKRESSTNSLQEANHAPENQLRIGSLTTKNNILRADNRALRRRFGELTRSLTHRIVGRRHHEA